MIWRFFVALEAFAALSFFLFVFFGCVVFGRGVVWYLCFFGLFVLSFFFLSLWFS